MRFSSFKTPYFSFPQQGTYCAQLLFLIASQLLSQYAAATATHLKPFWGEEILQLRQLFHAVATRSADPTLPECSLQSQDSTNLVFLPRLSPPPHWGTQYEKWWWNWRTKFPGLNQLPHQRGPSNCYYYFSLFTFIFCFVYYLLLWSLSLNMSISLLKVCILYIATHNNAYPLPIIVPLLSERMS